MMKKKKKGECRVRVLIAPASTRGIHATQGSWLMAHVKLQLCTDLPLAPLQAIKRPRKRLLRR